LASLLGVPANTLVRGLLMREVTAGTTHTRVGDQNVSATRGIPLSTTDSLPLPGVGAIYGESPMWNLSEVYVYAATGDILAIAYIP